MNEGTHRKQIRDYALVDISKIGFANPSNELKDAYLTGDAELLRTDICMAGRMYIYIMDGRIYMDGRITHGWTVIRIDGQIYVCMYACMDGYSVEVARCVAL